MTQVLDWSRKSVTVPGLGDATPFAYAQCVTFGPFVFIAGQAGYDENFKLVSPEFEAQARQALRNVGHALAAAGSSLDQLVSLTVHMTDMRYRRSFFSIRAEVFGNNPPTCALVGTTGLAGPELLVEIQAIGVRPI